MCMSFYFHEIRCSIDVVLQSSIRAWSSVKWFRKKLISEELYSNKYFDLGDSDISFVVS